MLRHTERDFPNREVGKNSKEINQGTTDYFRSNCKDNCTKLLSLICIHRNKIHQVEVSHINKLLHTCYV